MAKPLEERFHNQYIPVTESGCWLWTGAGMRYGAIKNKGEIFYAHRISYEMHNGKIPKGLCVLHRCDVQACVNPEHLFLGTKKDNAVDRMNKGRGYRPIGEKNIKARFTEDEVRKIRTSSKTIEELADHYDVTDSCIYQILNRITWKHI